MQCYEDFTAGTQWVDDTLIVTPMAENQRNCPTCPYPYPYPCGPSGGLVSSAFSAGTAPARRFRIAVKDAFGYDLAVWVQGGAPPTPGIFHHRVLVGRYGIPVQGFRVAMTAPVPPWDTLAVATTVDGAVLLEVSCGALLPVYNLTVTGPQPHQPITFQGLRATCGVPLQTVVNAE
jgi:hypothetical protein